MRKIFIVMGIVLAALNTAVATHNASAGFAVLCGLFAIVIAIGDPDKK